MKKILVTILAFATVFCIFAGCNNTANNEDSNTTATDNTGTDISDDTGYSENEGNIGSGDESNSTDKIMQPISDGGSFDVGGDFNH